jgi:hypothetical protein
VSSIFTRYQIWLKSVQSVQCNNTTSKQHSPWVRHAFQFFVYPSSTAIQMKPLRLRRTLPRQAMSTNQLNKIILTTSQMPHQIISRMASRHSLNIPLVTLMSAKTSMLQCSQYLGSLGSTASSLVLKNWPLGTMSETSSSSDIPTRRSSRPCLFMPGQLVDPSYHIHSLFTFFRIGMHLLFYGRAETKVLKTQTIENLLKEQSIKVISHLLETCYCHLLNSFAYHIQRKEKSTTAPSRESRYLPL